LKRKKYIVIILLTAILTFHFLNNFIWLKKDNSISGVDAYWHFIEIIKFQLAFRRIFHSSLPFFGKIAQLFSTFKRWPTMNWPPFYYLVSSLINPGHFYMLRLRLYANFIFYFILVLSTYFFGKKCFNRRVGLLASFLVSFYPSICAFSRQCGLDFPLTGLTALCVCLLVYSEDFSKINYSLLFGLSLGISTLVKLQVIFFLSAPLVYSIIRIFSKERKEKPRSLLNLILGLILAWLLFSLYWGFKLKDMIMDFYNQAFFLYPLYSGRQHVFGTQGVPIFSLKNFTFYPAYLPYLSSLYLFGLFILGLIMFLRGQNRLKAFFLSSLLVPCFILTFISVKWGRYEMPLLIFTAIISAWAVDNLESKYLKRIVTVGLLFYCVGMCLSSSWGWAGNYNFSLLQDIWTQPPYRPEPYDYIEEMRKEGVIVPIEDDLVRGKEVRIWFRGHVEELIGSLYLFFQDYIFDDKIAIKEWHGRFAFCRWGLHNHRQILL